MSSFNRSRCRGPQKVDTRFRYKFSFCGLRFICLCIREIAQYLRSRKHLGVSRSVDYFEFARAFAAIRYGFLFFIGLRFCCFM
jgi:hypothetical protein